MAFELVLHHDPDYAEGLFSGAVSADELTAIAQQAWLATSTQLQPRILADLTDMLGGHTAADLSELGEGICWKPGTREAVVLPNALSPEAVARIQAWAYSGVQRGLELRMFQNRAAALHWLLSDAESDETPAPR